MTKWSLNVNGLSVPSKRDCQNAWKNKTYLYVVLKDTHFKYKDAYRLSKWGEYTMLTLIKRNINLHSNKREWMYNEEIILDSDSCIVKQKGKCIKGF